MLVVGIGTSAGGLEALLPFVAQLSADNDMSYIIFQHSSAQNSSMLAELLQKKTTLDVQEATDGARLCASKIYVAPPGKNINFNSGCIQIIPARSVKGPKTSIDYFFSTLAEAYQEKAIGIVFSGTGHDGANGIKAIKAVGGVTIAQQPGTAKFDGMPKAAIEYGKADFILTPEDAALKLEVFSQKLNKPGTDTLGSDISEPIKNIVNNILKATGMDFVNYKHSTLVRQMGRRMAVLHIDNYETYDQFIRDNPEELAKLAESFLVRVTSFFRDDKCFNALRLALKEILKGKKAGESIRIWVPGCATGQEVYSIAILLAEELGAELSRYVLQIYGTDINAEAIHIARRGEYSSDSLDALETTLKTKYFVKTENGFLISKAIRDLVIFSQHDLIKNPPFIHLDLVSCRNLLIYFNQTLQEHVLTIFHYALEGNGILFLGQSESLKGLNNLFSEFERNSKLFAKNNIQGFRPGLKSNMLAKFQLNRTINRETPSYQAYKMLGLDTLVDFFAPPSLLITSDGSILEFYKNCDAFIRIKPGRADFNIFSIIHPALKSELKAYCHHAVSNKEIVTSPTFTLEEGENPNSYRMRVMPVYHHPSKQELLLITFEQKEYYPEITDLVLDSDLAERLTALKHELKTTRETLQTITEALETSISESQELNEAAQFTAEELQSTNEELETTNEELQSINEELTLVNDEITEKSKELGQVNDDLHNVLDSIEKAVIVVDSQLRINRFNEASKNFFTIDFADSSQPNLGSLTIGDNFKGLISHIKRVIKTGKSFQYKVIKENRDYGLNIYPYRGRNTVNITGAVLTIHDITERCQAEQQIRLSSCVFEAANEAITITDADNRILAINPAFTRITGYEKDDIIGKNPKILTSGRQEPQFYVDMWKSVQETGAWQGEIWNKRKDGTIYPELLSISALKDEKGKIIRHIGIFTDISATLKDRQTIIMQANYDALTNLPNRNLFYDRLKQAMLNAERTHKLVGVMFIDLDGFKDINDALGHSQGDIVLQQIAKRMVSVFREADTIARFGGDEFTVLINSLEFETDIIPTVEKILQAIQAPITINDHELTVTASIGVTLYPNDGNDIETLLKHADSAMYTAKAEGRNSYRFFTADMHEKAMKQHSIANEVKYAIRYNQFTVFYQPVYDLFSQRMIGAEALIRWQHPEKGFISPAEFIPIVESLNLISTMGEFVLDTACRFIAGINAGLDEPLSIAVNFSSLQFVPGNCAEKWIKIIKDSGIDLNLVVVEITESLMMNHQEYYIRQLQILRQHGIKVALDDFGTGYSSLSYLKKLPVDILKIDQSFIRDVLMDPSDAALVETIIAIAKNFSLELIAEGVEEKGQEDFLMAQNCKHAQGYYYSKPVPEAEFRNLTLKNQSFL